MKGNPLVLTRSQSRVELIVPTFFLPSWNFFSPSPFFWQFATPVLFFAHSPHAPTVFRMEKNERKKEKTRERWGKWWRQEERVEENVAVVKTSLAFVSPFSLKKTCWFSVPCCLFSKVVVLVKKSGPTPKDVTIGLLERLSIIIFRPSH